MSDQRPAIGSIGWLDLTVEHAEQIRDFYKKVVGWTDSPVSMGDYSDYSMIPPGADAPVAGVCHKRGVNNEIPSHWMAYIVVADLDKSIAECREHGGSVIVGPKGMGGTSRYCVIKDPAGAVVALYQS